MSAQVNGQSMNWNSKRSTANRVASMIDGCRRVFRFGFGFGFEIGFGLGFASCTWLGLLVMELDRTCLILAHRRCHLRLPTSVANTNEQLARNWTQPSGMSRSGRILFAMMTRNDFRWHAWQALRVELLAWSQRELDWSERL